MRVGDIILENVEAYIQDFVAEYSEKGFEEAYRFAKTDSKIRAQAQGSLDQWVSKVAEMSENDIPSQQELQGALSAFVHGEMQVEQSRYSQKAMQELVDLTSVNRASTNVALDYMTQLFVLSVLGENVEPMRTPNQGEIENAIDFGGPSSMNPGDIVPVQWGKLQGMIFVRYNDTWFQDMDGPGRQFMISEPVPEEGIGQVEGIPTQTMAVRVGPTGSGLLKMLRPEEEKQWLNAQVMQAQGA